MAFTTEQLDALEAAIAQGVLEVRYADKTIVYRSLAEMQTIRRQMREALGITTAAVSRRYAEFHRGDA